MRYRTLSGDLWISVVEDRSISDKNGELIDGWKITITGNNMMTRLDVAEIPDAAALPFFILDLLALLQTLPRTVTLDQDRRQIKVVLARLYEAYDIYPYDSMRFPCVTMRKAADRMLNHPKDLTRGLHEVLFDGTTTS